MDTGLCLYIVGWLLILLFGHKLLFFCDKLFKELRDPCNSTWLLVDWNARIVGLLNAVDVDVAVAVAVAVAVSVAVGLLIAVVHLQKIWLYFIY